MDEEGGSPRRHQRQGQHQFIPPKKPVKLLHRCSFTDAMLCKSHFNVSCFFLQYKCHLAERWRIQKQRSKERLYYNIIGPLRLLIICHLHPNWPHLWMFDIAFVCLSRSVCTAKMQRRHPRRRTCRTWTWVTWGRSSVKKAKTPRANQRSLSLNWTAAPETNKTHARTHTLTTTTHQQGGTLAQLRTP